MDKHTVFEAKTWESNYLNHLEWLLDSYRIDLVVDVGANIGQFGQSLRNIGYAGEIISFEPVQSCAARLAELVSTDPSWNMYPFALGRDDSIVDLNVSRGTGSSFLTPNQYGMTAFTDLRTWAVQQVPIRRLDSTIGNLPIVSDARILLKMDTQGYDIEVFAGSSGLMPQVVAVQSEVSCLAIYSGMPSIADSLAVYRSAGFDISGMFPVTVEARTGRVLEYDCVLVKPEAVAEH